MKIYTQVVDGDSRCAAHLLGLTYEQLGDYESALKHRTAPATFRTRCSSSAHSARYGSSGQHSLAQALLVEPKAFRDRSFPHHVMLIHLGLGDWTRLWTGWSAA